MPKVLSLSANDDQLIGDIIGDSFADDPVNRWVFGSHEAMKRYYSSTAKKLYLQKGFGHVTDDDSGGTLWLPPGVEKQIPLWRSMDIAAAMIRYGGLKSISRGMALDNSLARSKPTSPHYYLFAIGCRPNQQGRGIGSRLMEAGLLQVDAEKMPAYLESSKESNIPFYRRYGFEVTEELKSTAAAPSLWLMWRAARGQ